MWARSTALLALSIVTGCSISNGPLPRPDLSQRPARVVATTGMVADMARQVAGPFAEVDVLMGPGVDPHQYKANPGDLKKLQHADLILTNGLHLEGKMGDVLQRLSGRVRTAAVAECLPVSALRPAPEGLESVHDPHVWFDVRLWAQCVNGVLDAFIDLDPERAEIYQRNASAYRAELLRLDDDIRQQLAQVPPKRRVLITAHDAFYYFGAAYGFEVHGLQGISTATEASPADVTALARLIGSRRIPAVFSETSVPSRNLEAVRAAVRRNSGFEVRVVTDALYSDALGDADSPAGTYVGMIRHNVAVIVRELSR